MKHSTRRNRAVWTAACGGALLLGYLLCRYPLLGLHGMKEWPRNLFVLGLLVLAAAAALDARKVMACTPVGYLAGFGVGMLLGTDGMDPGGGRTGNGWMLWTACFLAAILLGIVLDVVGRRRRH